MPVFELPIAHSIANPVLYLPPLVTDCYNRKALFYERIEQGMGQLTKRFLLMGILALVLVACSGNEAPKSRLQGASSGADGATRTPEPVAQLSLPVISIENAPQLALLSTWPTDGTLISFLAFTPDGTRLVSLNANSTLRVWEVASGSVLHEMHASNQDAWGFSLSSDGTRAATTGSENVVQLWDVNTGTQLSTLLPPGEFTGSLQFSPDGNALAMGYGNGYFAVRDVASGATILEGGFERGRSFINSLTYSPDGSILATAHAGNSIVLWNGLTGERLERLTDHSNDVYSITFSRDGRWMASTSADDTVRIWDVETRRVVSFLGHSQDTADAAFSLDGQLVATTGQNGILDVWRWQNQEGEEFSAEPVYALPEAITDGTFWTSAVVFSPDGTRLAYGNSAGEIKILGVVDASN